MIFPLKYNTASQEVPLGFFLDTSTGNIEQTSLTIANTDIKLWKSGATTLANKNSGGATHISNGIYYCVLDATDTNTYGPLEIFIHVSGALAFHKVCTVINSDAYDALMSASSGSIRSTVTAMSAGVITSTAIADELFYTSDQISQDVWEYTTRTLTSSGTATVNAADVWSYSSRTLSGDQSFILIGNVSGNVNGSVGSVVGSVGSVTGAVGSVAGNVSGSVGSVVGAVGSVAGNVSGSVASVTGAVGSVTGAVGSVAGNVSGSVGSVVGSVGSVAGNVSGSVASVVGAVGSVAGNVSGSVGSVSGLTTSTIASSVWGNSSRTLSGDQSFTLIGNVSGNITGSVGSVTTVSDKTGYSLASTQSYTLIGNVSGNVNGSVGSVIGAVGSVAGNVSGSVGSVTGNVAGSVASVTGAVGSVAGNVSGSVASVTGNVSGSVGSVVNGATLIQINSLVSGIRGTDNDSLKTVSDQIDGISVSGSTPAEIWGYGTRTLTTNIPTVQEIVDGVWDELMVNHTSTGTTGNQLATMGTSAGSITIDPSSIWNYATRTITGGTIDTVSGNVNGSVGSVLGNISGNVIGSVGSVAGNVSGSVGSVLGDINGNVSGYVGRVVGNVSGSVASVVNGATLTQINSLVSGIRGTDNDSIKTISDQLDSISGATPATIWSYSSRSLSGNQSFTLIGNVSGSVGSVTSPVTVGTNNDKTNYSLSATQTFTHIGNVSGNVTGSIGSVTTVNDKTGYSLSSTQTYTLIGNVSGNVNGSVGSVVGSVGSVAGNVSGSVASVVNGATLTQINSLVSGIRGADNDSLKTLSDQVDNVTVSGATAQAIWEYTNRTLTSSGTAAIDYTQVANAVWDELLSLHTVSGSAGKQLSSTVTSSGAVYVNIAGAEIADAVWNAETATYNVAGSMGRALTSTGTAVIDASDVWNYGTRTLTSSTGNATLANQEIIINHLTDIKGDGWTDEDLVAIMTAIENGTWGGFGV